MNMIELAVKTAMGLMPATHAVTVRVMDGVVYFKIIRTIDGALLSDSSCTCQQWAEAITKEIVAIMKHIPAIK